MFSIVPCQWIWHVFIPITYFATNSNLFMRNGSTLQGIHFDAFGPFSLPIGDHRMYEFLWHYLTVIIKYFGEISLKPSLHCLPFSLLPHKTTYIQRVLRHKISQISLFCCRFFFPMPQLTPNCERVLVLGFQQSDVT